MNKNPTLAAYLTLLMLSVFSFQEKRRELTFYVKKELKLITAYSFAKRTIRFNNL